MNPNQQPSNQQPFQPTVPPQQYQQPQVSSSMLPHKSSKLPVVFAVVFALLFICALVFGLWAFSERNDYKNNSDTKAASAVEAALAKQKDELSQEFSEQAKSPYLTFNGPATYGSFSFEYPKTWSVYVEESNQSANLFTVYMHPESILDIDKKENLQAFSLQVTGSSYDEQIKRLDSAVGQGRISASTFRPAQVESVLGLRVRGEIENDITGQQVFIPIRDRTLILTSESDDYASDFDRILSTLKFIP